MVISRTSAIPLETSGNAIMAQLDVNVVILVKGIGIPTFQVTKTVMSSMKHVLKTHIKLSKLNLSQYMRFPTIWHFDMCRLERASAASF